MKKGKLVKKATDVETLDYRIYRLKISLGDVHPPLWRRLEVYAGMEMDSLATAIDKVFGWSGEHMGEFDLKGRRIGDGTDWRLDDPKAEQREFRRIAKQLQSPLGGAEKARLREDLFSFLNSKIPQVQPETADATEPDIPTLRDLVPRARTKFTYIYDFGDNWEHFLEVEKIHEPEAGVNYPRCTDGARANPLEDCGGAWGYQEMVDAVGHPKHERYADLVELGLKKWNPEEFSAEKADRDLAKLFRRKK
jgi:hypothetical protein